MPEPVARRDAEGLEHHVSPETISAMVEDGAKPQRLPHTGDMPHRRVIGGGKAEPQPHFVNAPARPLG
ncbi:MAG: iron dependent repressor, metal binding and dimerization domain protein [Planctomycetaceae bacterium]